MDDIANSPFISGDDAHEKMRNLIKNTYNDGNAYNTYDGKLAYVNLFGDAFFDDSTDCVPTHLEGYDVYFTRLTQTNGQYDDYPDIMLGRCSVDTVTQVQNVVEKILNFKPDEYEAKNQCLQYCDIDTRFYAMINEEFGEIRNIIPGDSTFFITPDDFDQLYFHPEWILKKPFELETVLDVYEKELSFFNYIGHGTDSCLWANRFRYSDLGSEHTNKLPFGFFNTCLTGTFHLYDDCFCEEMLNQSTNRGMIATVGANKVITINVKKGYYLINSLYYNSPVIGSAYMECQLKGSSVDNDFNLFGDPALNLFYENIDTLKADMIVQKLTAFNDLINQDDTLKITTIISNLMNVDVDDNFVTSCYLRRVGNQNFGLTASITTNGLAAFAHDTLEFTIPANPLIQDFYECKVVVDTAGTVDELSKMNNSAETGVTILNVNPVNIEEPITSSIVPISYNIQNLADSNQIVAGTSIFSYEGDIIRNLEQDAVFYSGIGNAISGNVTFINSFDNTGDESTIFSYTMDSVWAKTPVSNEIFGQPCMGFIDNTGDDYIFFNEIYYADTNWHYNLTCLDYKCDQRWKLEDFSQVYSINPDLQPAGLLFSPFVYFDIEFNANRIITLTEKGRVYIIEENQNRQPFIADSVIIEGCERILNPIIAGDPGFNKEVKFAVSFYDLNKKKCLALIDAQTMQYDTVHVSNSNVLGPWMYDIDNNGEMEIIVSVPGNGFYVYDDQLNEIQVNDSSLEKFAGFCDADNDDLPEIIYQVKEDSRYYLKAKNILDSVVFKLPLLKDKNNYTITNKENNGKVDILLNSYGYLSNIELVENSKTWMWQGNIGNLKNNCMIMQPASYKSNDTVYWTDNISIPDTFEIPSGATVIIKPGTHVYAKEDAEFIVFGKLIAKGTEYHPIKFTANIMGAGKSYWGGITAKTTGTVEMEYCEIENAMVGLFFYSTASTMLKYNTFRNNNVGICSYANSPKIKYCYFTDNTIAVAAHAGSTPYLASPFISTDHYNNGLINNATGISIFNSLPYVRNGYNDIYNDTLGTYMIFNDDVPDRRLRVGNNYYGSTVTSEVLTHFDPSTSFEVTPLLQNAQTKYKDQSADEASDLLSLADSLMQQAKYTEAQQIFYQIIESWPAENEALWAITGIYQCHRQGNLPWLSFIESMEPIALDSTLNTPLRKYSRNYMLLAMRHNLNYQTAIDGYEDILSSQPSWYDSLYALINISNTLLESGGYKSQLMIEGMDSRLIESEISHIKRTKELLFSTPEESKDLVRKMGCVTIQGVFPNPSRGSFTINYSTCKQGATVIELFTISGKRIWRRLVYDKTGIHNLTTTVETNMRENLIPGVYLLKVTNNEQFDSEKIVIE